MTSPNDPILDQPQSIDVDALDTQHVHLLANHEVRFHATANSDLQGLHWPWANARYAASIRVELTAFRGDNLIALVNRYYPGYQETILGSEGVIVSKRLAAPFKIEDDHAAIWSFECQSEGDSLLRMDVEIDWGEPLTQRIVDGLLVAQRNPRPQQGIYQQSNAESTRVFGNPQAHPEQIELDDASGRAHLVYFVLINGIAEVSLLLTVSDVGEQMAWNAFLSLRDVERSFELSNKAWSDTLKTARLWTPNAQFNHAVQAGKLATLQHLIHLRTGMAPSNLRVECVPLLVDSLDALAPVQSRNLLAHLRRVAERSTGRLPISLQVLSKQKPVDPGADIVHTNGAYLSALLAHLRRRTDAALLAEHYTAVGLCAEMLVQNRLHSQPTTTQIAAAADALRAAHALAMLHGDKANALRWANAADEFKRVLSSHGGSRNNQPITPDWATDVGWRTPDNRPWGFADPWQGVAFAGQTIWLGCGLRWQEDGMWVAPTWPADWRWWALLGLPTAGGNLSLVWDGETLHATLPTHSTYPVLVHRRIRALNTDDTEFNLRFEFSEAASDTSASTAVRTFFHPQFDVNA